MNELPPSYEKVVTTERPAGMLARKHGFEDAAHLAKSLPENANVLDVGAGASSFGSEIAELRPDISWTNLDYSYQDPAIYEDVTRNVPDNVGNTPGDVAELESMYEHETFDAVFSYMLMSHLSLDDPEIAKKAAKNIFDVTKIGGLISIGPDTSKRRLPTTSPKEAYRLVKDESMDAETFAESIVDKTRLKGLTQSTQKMANEVATPFFGTTRYTKREEHVPYVYNPESGDYIHPLSRKGAEIVGKLAVQGFRYIRDSENNKQ